MKLEELLGAVPVLAVSGDVSGLVSAVTADSRQAGAGVLFVAVTGTKVDGHRYVEEALGRGAAGVVVSEPAAAAGPGTRILVKDTRPALALLALGLRGHPEKRLSLAGVTGTNGKSTTAHLLAQVLEAAGGKPVGLLGTLGGRVGGRELPHSLTTPDAVTLARLFSEMVEAGADTAVMEVSSHAIAMGRILGLSYKVAAYTNLSANEHLDFHGTVEEYKATKLRLFSEFLDRDGTAVINADDPAAEDFVRAAGSAKVIPYGMGPVGAQQAASLRASQVEPGLQGNRFVLTVDGQGHEVDLPVPGLVNVANYLAAFGAALGLGVPTQDILRVTPRLRPVRGRLEPVRPAQPPPFDVFIDFAHTPAALEQLLAFLRGQAAGRLIVLFGCGGDRDRSKRPLMGAAAARYADEVVLSSDNPRSEDPEAILGEIAAGLGGRSHHREADRERAIGLALGLARPGDVVAVAGKGHETTQETAGKLTAFDDRAVVLHWLEKMGFAA